MRQITPDDLAEHLATLEEASAEDLDELLAKLLAHAWPTKYAQDS